MGITKYGSLLGAVGILTPPGGELADAGVVEAFVSQASVAAQRKKAEDALLRAAEEWRRTFDAVPDVVFLVDTEHRILRANRAAAERFGKKWRELIGQKCFRVVHNRNKPAADCPLAPLFATGEEQRHEEIYSPLVDAYFDFTFAPVAEEEGGIVAAVMVGRDVTERRRANRLAEVQRDLAHELATSVDLGEAARLSVRAAIAASGLEAGGLYVVDERTGALELVHAEGLTASFLESASHFDATSPNADLVQAGDPIYSNYSDLGVPVAGSPQRERLRAVAVLPVKFEGEVVACLNVASRTQDDVSIWTRRVLEGIAIQIGGVIARIKQKGSLAEACKSCENFSAN
jgi:PAS domain S-box-containing protein